MARPSPQTDRVVALFDVLSADPRRGLSLAEISRRLGVHKASCHSMLAVLLGAGWLLRDPARKTYQLGPTLLRLGAAASAALPAVELARPTMAELAATTGGHCIAFLVDHDHVTVVDQVRNVRVAGHPMALGTELPTRPPYGAAVAAWASADDQEHWLADAPADTRDRYRHVLRTARQRGYMIGLQVLPDVRLQELASLIRAAEVNTRLADLTKELADDLMHREEWFPVRIDRRRTYEVSHIDAPVLAADGGVVMMLSLLPVPGSIPGAVVTDLGAKVAAAADRLTTALAGVGLTRS